MNPKSPHSTDYHTRATSADLTAPFSTTAGKHARAGPDPGARFRSRKDWAGEVTVIVNLHPPTLTAIRYTVDV